MIKAGHFQERLDKTAKLKTKHVKEIRDNEMAGFFHPDMSATIARYHPNAKVHKMNEVMQAKVELRLAERKKVGHETVILDFLERNDR